MIRRQYYEHFIVVIDTTAIDEMVRRLNEIGDVKNIFENVFALTPKNQTIQTNDILDKITGNEGYYTFVIRYKDELRAYWNIWRLSHGKNA